MSIGPLKSNAGSRERWKTLHLRRSVSHRRVASTLKEAAASASQGSKSTLLAVGKEAYPGIPAKR